MAFVKPSDLSGSSYFKSGEYMTALAILFEPKSIARDVESTFGTETRKRDEAIADITIFGNSESLETGVPTEIIKSTKVTHGMMVDSLSKAIDNEIIGVVRRIPTKRGSGFAIRDAEAAGAVDNVIAYFEKRTAAEADALAGVPDFGDE